MGKSKSGAAALQSWCRAACSGYPGVDITNMSSAWRDGRAFCAVIHRYRPDILHWGEVDTTHWDRYVFFYSTDGRKWNSFFSRNCHLAFTVAEEQLGIPRLLDVEDVVSHPSPDRLSILTYISQFYHKLAHSGPDSGISSLSQSPASSDSEAESLRESSSSAERRGAIISLMDGRRVRSVSCHTRMRGRSEGRRPPSPPIEQENPFIKEFYDICLDYKDLKQVKPSPIKSFLRKLTIILRSLFLVQKLANVDKLREKENHCSQPRMVQSMFIESRTDFSLDNISFPSSHSVRPFLTTTAKPKPYKNVETKNSVSILSKTDTYLQERKRRSKSQPPEKRVKQQFEFLSTSCFSSLPNKVV